MNGQPEATPSDPGEPEESLSEERSQEVEEFEHEMDLKGDAALSAEAAEGAAMAGVPFLAENLRPAGDPRSGEAARANERLLVEEYAELAGRLRDRPDDRVSVFDALGESVGVGVRDVLEDGRTVVRVPSDVLDVAARAEDGRGAIPDVVFRPLLP